MTLQISATDSTQIQREQLQTWLKQICWRVKVAIDTGGVSYDSTSSEPADRHGLFEKGCECLKKIIEDRSHAVTIHAATADKKITGAVAQGADETTVGKCGGGATVPKNATGGYPDDQGHEGSGVGSDVYIDMGNNNGKGYPKPVRDGWLILAHELTGGHAYQLVSGTCAKDKDAAERQAIDSENEQRTEHGGEKGGYPLRPTGG